jgi:hypothetical protein
MVNTWIKNHFNNNPNNRLFSYEYGIGIENQSNNNTASGNSIKLNGYGLCIESNSNSNDVSENKIKATIIAFG